MIFWLVTLILIILWIGLLIFGFVLNKNTRARKALGLTSICLGILFIVIFVLNIILMVILAGPDFKDAAELGYNSAKAERYYKLAKRTNDIVEAKLAIKNAREALKMSKIAGLQDYTIRDKELIVKIEALVKEIEKKEAKRDK